MRKICVLIQSLLGLFLQNTFAFCRFESLIQVFFRNICQLCNAFLSFGLVRFSPKSFMLLLCFLHTRTILQHPSIRKFPSKHFYNDKLQDASEITRPERIAVGAIARLWPAGQDVRLVFCHVQGQEESPQDFTGFEGREDSKFNELEVKKTVSEYLYVLFHFT